MKNQPYQRGITLIEMMIALLIGAFLLIGIIQVFIGSRQTNRMQENLSRLQENGRFALDFLAKDIRMAGFLGCNSDPALITTTCTAAGVPAGCKMPNTLQFSPPSYLYDFGTAIQGFEADSAATWSPALDAAISTTVALGGGGTDVITIRRAADQGFTVTAHASATANLTLDASATAANLTTAGLNNCATAVVNDCSAAAVFQVSGVAAPDLSHAVGGACAPQNATDDLGKTYVNAQVYPINTISYFIRTNPSGEPALYYRVGANAAVELVEGIENMQILYGDDTDADGTPNYYVSADTVGLNMARVVSIRITLTVHTLDSNLTADGGRITRNFTSTIAVRNRLP